MKKYIKIHIGRRTVKTAAAVIIAMYLVDHVRQILTLRQDMLETIQSLYIEKDAVR